MKYLFECPACNSDVEVFRSIVEGPPTEVQCTGCGGQARRVWTVPEVHKPGAFIPFTHLGTNLAQEVGRTPAQQERMYARVIERNKLIAREKKRSRGRRAEGKTELAAEIPREMYIARQQQFGKNYWQEEGRRALRRDGLV